MIDIRKNKMKRRKSDSCMIIRIWDSIGPYWHICTTVFIVFVTVSWWVKDVNALPDIIAMHDKRLSTIEEKIEDIAIVKQRVDDIANFMGVPRKRK